ncbi:MAG: site-specific integrase [Microgenomates group bacterium]|jgi:hypothetical protein|nr:site-specific integrase [Candidatus Woesebacteria bacterium]
MNKAYNLYNIEALFLEYLSAGNNGLNATTIKNYSSDFKHFIGWIRSSQTDSSKDNLVQDAITEPVILKYIHYLNDQEVSSKTFSRRLSTLRKFIQFCSDSKLNLSIDKSIIKSGIITSVSGSVPAAIPSRTLHQAPSTSRRLPLDRRFLNSSGMIIIIILLMIYTPLKLTEILRSTSGSASISSSVPLKTGRVFAFQGRLTDSLGNNITNLTSIQFKLYNSPKSPNALYQTGLCSITPDRNGFFSVLIGGSTISPPPQQDICGKEVGSGVFSENPNVYLGTTIASDNEMSPRQQIANVGYATNAESLQGRPLGSTTSSVPYISSDGTVILSINSPIIASTYTSGTFSITSGSNLSLETANDGDITLNATGSGSIRLKTGGSNKERIYISDGGNVGINTTSPTTFRLEVSGDLGPEFSDSYNLGSSTRIWNDVFADRLCLDGSSDCITSSLGIFSALDLSTTSQLKIKGNLVSGNSVTSGSTTLDIGGTGTSYALCHNSQSGTDNQALVDCASTPTADFAEMYPVEKGAEFGDVMTLGTKVVKTTENDELRQLIKSDKPHDDHVIGVISNNYSDFISVGHNIASSENPMPIALKGRVPVKISDDSEQISAGDYLTTSTEKGKAVKSVGDGVVIGKALESWEKGSIKNKIMVFVGLDYVVQSRNPLEILAQGISTAVKNQFETVLAERVISPVVETSEIKPEPGKDLAINLTPEDSTASNSSSLSKLVIKGLKKAVVASIDAEGNIKSNGTVQAENGIFNNSISADTIKSRTTDNLTENLNEVQVKLSKLSMANLTPSMSDALPSEVLSSISHESLTSHLVVTELADINALTVQDSITARSDTLHLMANSAISFFDGSIAFARNGNIVTKGTITAKELEIRNPSGVMVGSISATGSATFNNLQLPKTSGSSIIPEGENEVRVYNTNVSEATLVYITPETNLNFVDKPLVVKEKHICNDAEADCVNYFTVAMSTNNHPDLRFNWLIIN